MLDKQVDCIENQSRCNNTCIDGLMESKCETWQQTEDKCLEFFRNALELSEIQVERVHRIGVRE